MVNNVLFFVFYIDFYIFLQFFNMVQYDSHKQIFKSIFKLKLKLYEDNIPILICCKNEVFMKSFYFMPVSVLQWCASGIGIFYYCAHPVIKNKFSNSNCFPKVRCVISYLYYFFCSLILLTHCDVETNPGSKKSHSYFSCHWNVNSLIAHNKLKVSLLEACNTVHKYDFICISETYFDSSVKSEDDDLRINGYKLI